MSDNTSMSFGCYRPEKHRLEKLKKPQMIQFAVFPKTESGIIKPKEAPRWRETISHRRTGHGHIRIKRIYFCEIENRPKSEILKGRAAREWLDDSLARQHHKDKIINEAVYKHAGG